MKIIQILFLSFFLIFLINSQDSIKGCGGFIKISNELKNLIKTIDLTEISIELYNTDTNFLKEKQNCAPNGYYFIPIYEAKGDFILTVKGPEGWSFVPNEFKVTISDEINTCENDINFEFSGLEITGKVESTCDNCEKGVKGINVNLIQNERIIRTSKTNEKGIYTFKNLLPDKYSFEIDKSTFPNSWIFDIDMIKDYQIDFINHNVNKPLTIKRFSIEGKVLDSEQNLENNKIANAKFILFTTKEMIEKNGFKIENEIKTIKEEEIEYFPILTTESDLNGLFTFSEIPCGDYVIIPVSIPFQLEPNFKKISVVNNVFDAGNFKVLGFTAVGYVKNKGGSPISNVLITINGKETAITNEEGQFKFGNLQKGNFQIKAQKNHFYFDNELTKNIILSPSNYQIQDIIAVGYDLCGTIKLQNNQELKRKINLQMIDSHERKFTQITDNKGEYCFKVISGEEYTIQPILTQKEIENGFSLNSITVFPIQVQNEPIFNIDFIQTILSISGKINCILSNCFDLKIKVILKENSKQISQETFINKDGSFVIDNVIPGNYKIRVDEETFCWENEEYPVQIETENIANIVFQQKGFLLKAQSSNSFIAECEILSFSQDSETIAKIPIQFNQGLNLICLEKWGLYRIKPDDCFLFEKEEYFYNYQKSRNEVIDFKLTHIKVEGILEIEEKEENLNEIQIDIKTIKTKTSDEGEITDTKTQTIFAQAQSSSKPSSYQFTHYAKIDSKTIYIPKSKSLLFYPKNQEIENLNGQECPIKLRIFEGKKGKFITGKITPALEDVRIIIKNEAEKEEYETKTDSKGKYKYGPVEDPGKYQISAIKAGYVFTEEAEKGMFRFRKLGSIKIKIEDKKEGNKPVSNVLLSLSSSSGYRSNNIVGVDGTFLYQNLEPGEYYLSVMLKEYDFTPSSGLIKVEEGKDVDFSIEAFKVAFSLFGSITTLNNKPITGLTIRAESQNLKEIHQEETQSNSNGNYRIRGLKPNVNYLISVMKKSSSQKIIPNQISVHIDQSDVSNLNFIGFDNKNNLSQIIGIVNSSYINNITIELVPKLDSIKKEMEKKNFPMKVHPIPLSLNQSFFYFPNVLYGNYSVILNTDLSRNEYTFDKNPQIEIIINENENEKLFGNLSLNDLIQFDFYPKNLDNSQFNSSSYSPFISLFFLLLLAISVIAGLNYKITLEFYKNYQQSKSFKISFQKIWKKNQTKIDDSNDFLNHKHFGRTKINKGKKKN
ncbi:nodal modulator 1-related [Anaeramoeba ignava]|uniref:Nodal modulator 1-related n=1 Tax=Anaeramoeba ignava TaxID=1746090 RepID=A0A9Q0LNS6_ANAIG|nr:nodal modulator 1-related [Anaeramoeba ignava]